MSGSEESFTLEHFGQELDRYKAVDVDRLFATLVYFLRTVVSMADEVGVDLAILADDPLYPILELLRILLTTDGFRRFIAHVANSRMAYACVLDIGIAKSLFDE